MQMTHADKEKLKRDLVGVLATDAIVEKIVIFGSFVHSETPHDMDVAVFCDSDDDYLTLALSLRRKLRSLSRIIPIDLVPITGSHDPVSVFLEEVNKGEVIYEKRH